MSSRANKRISSTPEGAFGLIRRHVSTAVVAVFGDYQIEAAPCVVEEPASSTEDIVVAIIGFAGEHLRGSLVLTARASSVECWRGPFGNIDASADERDILGELANMVLGRLKGKLLAEGLPILMSTPTTARGPAVMLARSGRPEELLAFAGEGWTISARIDAAFDAAFGLQEEPTAVAAQAGDVMLF
ncbi:MAG: chemotaxis protein CheX [Polyangiaceae bacterium]